ncbi:MAG: hypothetical protein JSS29_09170 [Proteobacteria bacterium]|nr:hypothetical protein [Pseudomonadota bacterium]
MTTPLNELVRRLALLAAPRTYSMTARLIGGKDGNQVELRATQTSAGEILEYARHVNLTTLERDGAEPIARQFALEARTALSSSPARLRHSHRARR